MEDLRRGRRSRERSASPRVNRYFEAQAHARTARRPALRSSRAFEHMGGGRRQTAVQDAGGQSLERRSPGEQRTLGQANPLLGDRGSREGSKALKASASGIQAGHAAEACRATMVAGAAIVASHRPGSGRRANVRRAADTERRHGSSRRRKALKGEPHGRQRDETSPRGERRNNPSRGCKTLETVRSRARQTRQMSSWTPRAASAVGAETPEGTAQVRATRASRTRRCAAGTGGHTL